MGKEKMEGSEMPVILREEFKLSLGKVDFDHIMMA